MLATSPPPPPPPHRPCSTAPKKTREELEREWSERRRREKLERETALVRLLLSLSLSPPSPSDSLPLRPRTDSRSLSPARAQSRPLDLLAHVRGLSAFEHPLRAEVRAMRQRDMQLYSNRHCLPRLNNFGSVFSLFPRAEGTLPLDGEGGGEGEERGRQ